MTSDLQAEVTRLHAALAEAREALPIVRRQDYFDATLMECIKATVSHLFSEQSRAEVAEAALAQAQQERASWEMLAHSSRGRAETAEANLKGAEQTHAETIK